MIQSPVLQIFLFGQLQEHHVQRIYGTSIINVENISATTQFIEYERVHESTLPEQAKMILNAEMGQRSEK